MENLELAYIDRQPSELDLNAFNVYAANVTSLPIY